MIQCPKCQSKNVVQLNYGKRVAGGIGMASGFIASLKSASSGAQIGIRVGAFSGPFGMTTGAILGGLAGGLAGYKLGEKLGEVIDENILDNCQCLSCKYKFGLANQKSIDI